MALTEQEYLDMLKEMAGIKEDDGSDEIKEEEKDEYGEFIDTVNDPRQL